MQPQNTPKPRICVEYDCRGKRVLKSFGEDMYAARRFYTSKFKDGKNPKVKKEQTLEN